MSLSEFIKKFKGIWRREEEKGKAEVVNPKVFDDEKRKELIRRILEEHAKVAPSRDLYVIFGRAIPKDRSAFQRILRDISVFAVDTKNNRIVVSLYALSFIWKDFVKKSGYLKTLEEDKKVEIAFEHALNAVSGAFEALREGVPEEERKEEVEKSPEVSPVTEEVKEEKEDVKVSEILEELKKKESFDDFLTSFQMHYSLLLNASLDVLFELEETKKVWEILKGFERSSRSRFSRLAPALLFCLLALERFGLSCPSVMPADRIFAASFSDKQVNSSGAKLASVLSRVPLYVHVIGAFFLAYEDYRLKLESKVVFPDETLEVLSCVLFHDIGKIPVYAEGENEQHNEASSRIIASLCNLPEEIEYAVRHHHEVKGDLFRKPSEEYPEKLKKLLIGYDRLERKIEYFILKNVSFNVPDTASVSDELFKEHVNFLRELLKKYGNVDFKKSEKKENKKERKKEKVEELKGKEVFEKALKKLKKAQEKILKGRYSYLREGEVITMNSLDLRKIAKLTPEEYKVLVEKGVLSEDPKNSSVSFNVLK
ncbi:MAG: hypothetical protein DSY42_04805 [Aquifex sp.]|nr:MAG: hypothetical protein DSY42_04805 [Aquifex sp.]